MSKRKLDNPTGSRLTLNEVLWQELQAVRPKHCSDPKFEPVGFSDPAVSGTTATGATAGPDQHTRRAKNLSQLFRRIGQLGRKNTPFEHETPLSALCFSGGGIRSATFNLGVIRALASKNLLGKFDYLSSVSGGGYIASWLRRWIHCERSCTAVERALHGFDAEGNPLATDPLIPEPRPIDHLRDFSNYLTPRLGLFSADTWTLGAIVLRNLLLNWLVIIPLIALLVSLPQLAYLFAYGTHSRDWGFVFLGMVTMVELFATASVHYHRRFARLRNYTSGRVFWRCVAPIIAAAAGLAAAALWLGHPWKPEDGLGDAWLRGVAVYCVVWCIAIPFLGWLFAETCELFDILKRTRASLEERAKEMASFKRVFRFELGGLLVSGAVAAWLLYLITKHWLPYLEARPALYAVLATPCLLAVYLLARTIFVAFAGRSDSVKCEKPPEVVLSDADREWWARLSAWVLGLTLAWIAGATLCIFGQALLVQMADWAVAAVAAAGGIAAAAAALLGSRDRSPIHDEKPPLAQKLALQLAAPLALVCVVALISWGTGWIGGKLLDDIHVFEIQSSLTRNPSSEPRPFLSGYSWFLLVPLGAFVLIRIMGRVVDVNRFSLHGMYRNRLVRAYLGASNKDRRPDLFTGFDLKDNVRMHQLRSCPDSGDGMRLLPVINVTLNLLRDGKLAWQQRKAESFSITPYCCGNFVEGYRDSKLYGGPGGITLGTAVTISGAAANPHMGYCSSPVLAFLMTLFNLRLGAWLGNTNDNGNLTYDLPGPAQALWPLIGELLGFTSKNFNYVNLSDGGHFDNLGLYEMVLRRCRNIVVCDAGCDGKGRLEDLGRAIRSIRIDFGISIEFDRIEIIPISEAGKGVYCATATISYPEIDGKEVSTGRLLYLKPTIAGRGDVLPYDIYSYSKLFDTFPHESTADQWFSESQFESYRKLGEHSMQQILQKATPTTIAEVIEQAAAYLKPQRPLKVHPGARNGHTLAA